MDELIIEYVRYILFSISHGVDLVKQIKTGEYYILFKEDVENNGQVVKISPETAEMLIKDLNDNNPIYVDWVGGEEEYRYMLDEMEE